MASGHNVKVTSWVAVVLIVVASILLGFALPLGSMVLAVVGGVLMVAGLFTAVVYRIMDDAY